MNLLGRMICWHLHIATTRRAWTSTEFKYLVDMDELKPQEHMYLATNQVQVHM